MLLRSIILDRLGYEGFRRLKEILSCTSIAYSKATEPNRVNVLSDESNLKVAIQVLRPDECTVELEVDLGESRGQNLFCPEQDVVVYG